MHTVYPATSFAASISYPSADYPTPTYGTGTTTQQTNGWANFTSNAILHRPDWSDGSGRPGIIGVHGSDDTAWSSFSPGSNRWGDYTRYLADAGFVILAFDMGALPFGNNLTQAILDNAFAYLTGITGGSKVGLLGTSAGGLACLSWAKKWPSRVAGTYLVNPYTDLDTSRGTTGWTTPWTIGAGDPNASFNYSGSEATNANIDGAFLATDDASWTTNAIDQGHVPFRYPTDWAGQQIVIAHAEYDAGVPFQMSRQLVAEINSRTVTFRPVTYSGASHEPYTLLAGSDTDAGTEAAGGLPRHELRDFFYSVL